MDGRLRRDGKNPLHLNGWIRYIYIYGKEKCDMKMFERPEIEIEKFQMADVITTSGDEGNPGCPDELPLDA